ncbi:helix-turn-helix domain-containing protein [Enterococcus faecalis]|nr:helix-turn-helix domain-containing protein [Enterococcus faecalis]
MTELSYEVMSSAVSGDPIAMQEVLDYFEGYIDRLCSHTYLDEVGRVDYGVDTIWKTQLQGKLLAAMLRFKM